MLDSPGARGWPGKFEQRRSTVRGPPSDFNADITQLKAGGHALARVFVFAGRADAVVINQRSRHRAGEIGHSAFDCTSGAPRRPARTSRRERRTERSNVVVGYRLARMLTMRRFPDVRVLSNASRPMMRFYLLQFRSDSYGANTRSGSSIAVGRSNREQSLRIPKRLRCATPV